MKIAYQNYGRIVAFEDNQYGQLGLGDIKDEMYLHKSRIYKQKLYLVVFLIR